MLGEDDELVDLREEKYVLSEVCELLKEDEATLPERQDVKEPDPILALSR